MSREQFELIRFGTIKRYITDVLNQRSSDSAVNTYRGRMNDFAKQILSHAADLAREEDIKTIRIRMMEEALDHHLGQRTLDPEEVMSHLRRMDPIALGQLNRMIKDHLEEQTQ